MFEFRPPLCPGHAGKAAKGKEVFALALITKAPRGTQDFVPAESAKMRYIEDTLMEIAGKYGFGEIRTPTFEHTELFIRFGGGYHRCGAEGDVHL